MAVAAALTVEEYLAFEERAERKHELRNGGLIEMPGGSFAHNALVLRIGSLLDRLLEATDCEAIGSEMKIEIAETGAIYYADAAVACPARIARFSQGVIDNPRVIVEVLSPSTEAYDRSEKFRDYIRLPSVQDIVYISSTRVQVEVLSRVEEGWLLRLFTGREATLRIPSIDVEISLEGLYANARLDG